MERFLIYIERYKLALLGTVVLHISLFLYANFATVEQPFQLPDAQVALSISPEEIAIEEEEVEVEREQQEQMTASEEVYNLATDANDTRTASYDQFSSQQVDEQVEREARLLEEKYFEEWASTHEGTEKAAGQSKTEVLPATASSEQENTAKDQSVKKGGQNNAFAGRVLVSFDLKGRSAHALPAPGYTCNRSGKVVIAVKVDRAGRIKSTRYNAALSRSADECMISKAIAYAKKSRFNLSDQSPNLHSGTIVYEFVGR